MPRTPELTPVTVLGEIRSLLLAEVMARPAPQPVVLSRSVATILVASLSEQIDRIEVLEESEAAADRLHDELQIARADIARLEMQRRVHEVERGGPIPWSQGRCRPRQSGDLINKTVVVVDLVEILAREHHAHRQMQPSDGGDAA